MACNYYRQYKYISTMSNSSTTVENENPKPTGKINCHNTKTYNPPFKSEGHGGT